MKEVVHVPTKELAEEVLRVAKENGLMTGIDLQYWECYNKDTYFRPSGKGGYNSIVFAKRNYDAIITAEEFLSRYTPKFRPIAMRCSQEQFDAVKSKLVGCCLVGVSNFTKDIYLVNNFLGAKLNISNVIKPDSNDRQVFEEWNEKTFLEYCGIEVKDEVNELEQLRKENEELKQQLKAIEDQPKVGDVCLFWDKGDIIIISKLSENGGIEGIGKYHNCIKATDENIQLKIKELQDEN